MNQRILVVEDDPHFLGILRDYLRFAGYEVVDADDGMAGWLAFDASPPNIVLSDVLLPLMDGFELASRINEDPRAVTVPVVLMSAVHKDAAAIRMDLKTCGAADYLVKPFSMMELRSTLRCCLGRAGRGASQP